MIAKMAHTTEHLRRGEFVIVIKDYGEEVLVKNDYGVVELVSKEDITEVEHGA